MKVSARNTFEGSITHLVNGPVSAEVEVTTAGGDRLVATITQASAHALGLALGKPVVALVKASSVLILAEAGDVKLSARNQLPGTITKLVPGPVSAEVIIALPGGTEIFATITREAIEELSLAEGAHATAVIKASSVILGVKN